LLHLLEPMSQHDDAIIAFQEGRAAEALDLLEELLSVKETSELWNDWAAVQLGLGQVSQAETGFVQALELDPENNDATLNLGLWLLGRGDSDRAVPLLTRALPGLQTEPRKMVDALLANLAVKQDRTEHDTTSAGRILRVLVVADTFPNPITDGRDLRLLQILKIWREQGDEVTFIAREAVNRRQCEPILKQAGISTYANDSERLASLGVEPNASSWSFRDLARQSSFDIAILIQSFNHGLSIPEQYIGDLRRYAPATRVVVFADQLHLTSRRSKETPLLDFERVADCAARQSEAFDRADAVLVPRQDDAVTLRQSGLDLHIEVASDYLTPTGLMGARERILSLKPKGVAEDFSALLIDTIFRERLTGKTGQDRVSVSLECYVRMASQLLADGNPAKAREQLRHIFGIAPGLMREGYFASQVFIVLKRCYDQLGETGTAERCASEARRCVTGDIRSVSAIRRGQRRGPLFSVIVPTYNRLPILRKCLAALEAQTLPPANFEVIVIDDGSSDGTQELLSQYQPPFLFQYLRQRNSGTGAARRNGVAHASGQYLLLMNDDTICAPDLLDQHLQVQRKYVRERWAVLGSFEYPAAARQRALTRYFCVEPFMFPQVSMEAGCPYGYSHFITCNLSIPRDAVVEAGSFDSIYKLSEDTELGIRLYERGYRVLYHPDAHAIHDHLPYPARNLIRRARVYGADYFYMFGRHPRVIREWAMPVTLTGMDEENAIRILSYVEEHRTQVEDAVTALERWDSVDFEQILADQAETAAMVLRLFQQAVPAIHWFYLFETMLQTMIRELGLKHIAAGGPVMQAAQAAGN
jgi:glycosyltransferase involved in cell wall biosynthesis/tetratricopeptide (TPR) repeat protein